MARKNRRTREAPAFSNRRLRVSTNRHRRQVSLTVYEDRRQWHPEGVSAPARSFSSTRHRLKAVSPLSRREPLEGRSKAQIWGFGGLEGSFEAVPARIGFERPKRVLVCVRRQQRREVLHALGKAGRGGFSLKPRWSEYSYIRCK